MESTTVKAFGDELTKIAFYTALKKGFTNAMKAGWNGPASNPQSWFGEGLKITPGMSPRAKAWEHISSLGGATKYLPVGGKGMMALGTGMMARDAMKDQDSTGQGRSKSERLVGLAANTAGGLAGAGKVLSSGWGKRHPLIGGMVGGIGGGIAAERLATTPWRKLRQARQAKQMQQQQMEMMQQPAMNTGATL